MEPVTKNEMKYEMNKAFAEFEKKIDARFERQTKQISEMLDALVRHIDERFEMSDRRMDGMRAAQADFAHVREVDRLSDRVTVLERKII